MENTKKTLVVNDWGSRKERDAIMEEYGDSEFPFFGKNQNDEDIEIHVSKESIVLVTYQKNKWIRKNYFYKGEFYTEELFEGKWE